MESNFGSSESNYGYNYGRSYGGYSSESSYPSESRNDYSSPLKNNLSESRTPDISSESRKQIWGTPADYENGWGNSNRSDKTLVTSNETGIKYNNLDDIDKLIERLEASLGDTKVTSERANQILAQRKQKIDELRKLVADARKVEEEEKIIRKLEQENSELDAVIDSLNKGLHR